jgi:hypothetical protein
LRLLAVEQNTHGVLPDGDFYAHIIHYRRTGCKERNRISQPTKSKKKDAFSNAPQKPYKREIALDCSSFRRIQSRAISLHSYYLTSLVNLSFYSFLPQSFLHFSDPDCSFLHTLSELPMFYRNVIQA